MGASVRPFIGRESELKQLDDLVEKKTASLVIIKGRRRIGKSRLIEEFAKNKTFYQFSGLAPIDGVTAQDQRNEFALQLSQQTGLPALNLSDWTELFVLLADKCKKGRVVILLDEITWMSHDDPTFLSKLKNAWDLHFKKNSKLILVLCGSISAWIEKNIISSTAFFGRISKVISLEELSLFCADQLLSALGFKKSIFEKLNILALTGGVPWYIELINPTLTANKNIKQLCFTKEGILTKEFKHIFHDLFGKRSKIYQSIVGVLKNGDMEYGVLAETLGYAKGSALTDYLEELISSGYISAYYSWAIKTGEFNKKIKRYRLSDNFLRFFFKYMQSKLKNISQGQYNDLAVVNLPGWRSMLGLQFENLIIKNRDLIYKQLQIHPEEILNAGPYFQTKTTRQKGCQIDYLIQTKQNTLYVCEIKFSAKMIGGDVVREVKEKIAKLSMPRGFAPVPVLIHCGEITESVAEYFAYEINIVELLSTR